ncbi:MAG: type II toxin-antitoxin system VapB family antitoxin [Acidobacteria bacterium]|nr:type II toxin-antitoxin system VapB family antitoxin [Acidobacteriota bacterium]
MALHINDEAVERTVRELAGVTGESMTEAIGTAAAERLARLRPSRPNRPRPSAEEIMELVRSYKLTPVNTDLTEDEILGHGPDGIPD